MGGSSGGGSSTTRQIIEGGYDAAYNARMARIAEQQQALAGQMFDFWRQYQAPLEAAQARVGMELLPAQQEYMQGYLASQTGMLPQQAALESRALDAQHQMLQPMLDVQMAQLASNYETLPYLHGYGIESIESARHLLPYQTQAQRSGAELLHGTNEMGLRLLPYQEGSQRTGFELQQGMNEMGQRLLPYQETASRTGLQLQGEQNAAGRYLLPQETQLTAADIQRQQALMPDRQYAAQKFYQEAAEGVNPEEWAARAGIDVGAAYAGSDAALRRDAARMGVDPSSGRFANAQGGYGLNMARDLAQARTQGRRAGEDENWKRRVMAAQYAQ
jgi:hypothetical protein